MIPDPINAKKNLIEYIKDQEIANEKAKKQAENLRLAEIKCAEILKDLFPIALKKKFETPIVLDEDSDIDALVKKILKDKGFDLETIKEKIDDEIDELNKGIKYLSNKLNQYDDLLHRLTKTIYKKIVIGYKPNEGEDIFNTISPMILDYILPPENPQNWFKVVKKYEEWVALFLKDEKKITDIYSIIDLCFSYDGRHLNLYEEVLKEIDETKKIFLAELADSKENKKYILTKCYTLLDSKFYLELVYLLRATYFIERNLIWNEENKSTLENFKTNYIGNEIFIKWEFPNDDIFLEDFAHRDKVHAGLFYWVSDEEGAKALENFAKQINEAAKKGKSALKIERQNFENDDSIIKLEELSTIFIELGFITRCKEDTLLVIWF